MSTPIIITDFETLLAAAGQEPNPPRLLFAFLRASLPDDHAEDEAARFEAGQGGALQPIMCVDKTLDELSSFAELVAESEQIEKDWQIVLVASLDGRDGVAPTPAAAELPLNMMMQAVEQGQDLSLYMAFDREGRPIYFN